MTLTDIARLTLNSTLIQIIPNYDSNMIISVLPIFILTACDDHHPHIAQYANDTVLGLFPSNTEPNVLRVVVEHKN